MAMEQGRNLLLQIESEMGIRVRRHGAWERKGR